MDLSRFLDKGRVAFGLNVEAVAWTVIVEVLELGSYLCLIFPLLFVIFEVIPHFFESHRDDVSHSKKLAAADALRRWQLIVALVHVPASESKLGLLLGIRNILAPHVFSVSRRQVCVQSFLELLALSKQERLFVGASPDQLLDDFLRLGLACLLGTLGLVGVVFRPAVPRGGLALSLESFGILLAAAGAEYVVVGQV